MAEIAKQPTAADDAPAALSNAAPDLTLRITKNVAVQVSWRPASAGRAGAKSPTRNDDQISQWHDAWRDGGRATFRPQTNEKGRPSFKLDKEDINSEVVALKKRLADAEKEIEKLRVEQLKAEAEIKEKEKVVAQALMERGIHHLPTRIAALVNACMKSAAQQEIDQLKAQLKKQREQMEESVRVQPGENVNSNVEDMFSPKRGYQSKSKPWEVDADDGARSLDSPAGGGGSSRQSTSRKGTHTPASAKHTNSDALQAARAEIERLQKLFNAGEVLRESLDKRIAELEAEVHRLRARTTADPGSPSKEGSIAAAAEKEEKDKKEKEELFTQDNRAFENYIRRIAGLPELPTPGKDKGDRATQRVKVGLGPKSSMAATRRGKAELEAKKANREWVIYEVTTETSSLAGAGTSAKAYITFCGMYGEYGPCLLERPDGIEGTKVLCEGSKDVFDICALDVGSLKAVVVSHDNSGPSPSWHLTSVTVRRARTEKEEARTFEFYYGGWISSEKGMRALKVEISLSSRQAGATLLSVSEHGKEGMDAKEAHVKRYFGKDGQGIDAEALRAACRNVCRCILELHMPDTVADIRMWGLATLTKQLISKPITPPPSCRSLLVMLVGPRAICTKFIEWFAGAQMTAAGMTTQANITLVCAGKSARVWQGQEAAGVAGHAEALLGVPRIGKCFCVEEVAGAEKRFAQVSFIHPPLIEGPVVGSDTTPVVQALQELREDIGGRSDTLKQLFKSFDKDDSGTIDLQEFKNAMLQLGIDMPDPRALRLFKALDVSGAGSIDYDQFIEAFKPPSTNFEYDLERALQVAGECADVIVTLMDPKNVHYKARELNAYKLLHAKYPSKMRVCAFIRDAVRRDYRLKSHVLPETHVRIESLFGLEPGTLPPIQTVFIPSDNIPADAVGLPLIHNGMDTLLMQFANGLLALENAAVDETHDNLRMMLDACFSCEDKERLEKIKPRMSKWLRAFSEATNRKTHPPAVRLHGVVSSGLKDLLRGYVVDEDIDAWTPAQVGKWLKTKGDLARHVDAFIDAKINGRKLLMMTEDTLKVKLGVESLGHRKEIMRLIRTLMEGRKNWLQQAR